MLASHDGYLRRFNRCVHTREITLWPDSLIVKDIVKGNLKTADAYFYFSSNLDVELKENILLIKGKNFLMSGKLDGIDVKLTDSSWHPQFGVIKKIKFLKCLTKIQVHKFYLSGVNFKVE